MKRTRDDSFDPVYPYSYTQTSISHGALVVTGVRTGNDNNDSDSNPGGVPSGTVIDAPLSLVNGHLGLNYGSGLQLYASALQVAPGNGLAINSYGKVAVKASAPLNADNASLQLYTGNGLITTENVLSVNAGSGLAFEGGVLQVTPGPGLYINNGTLAVRATGVLQADVTTGLDVAVGGSLSKTNNTLQVKTGPGLSIGASGLQVTSGTALSTLANGVNVNIGAGLRVTSDNALAIRTGGGLYTDTSGNLTVNAGLGLKVNNNILTANLGAGLVLRNGAITLASLASSDAPTVTSLIEDPAATALINTQDPLHYTTNTLSLSLCDDFIVQGGALALQLEYEAPLKKTGRTISLQTGHTLSVTNGTLDTNLRTHVPLTLDAQNLLSLNYGRGLTLYNDKLSLTSQPPLIVDETGLSLQIGKGLKVQDGLLTVSDTLIFSLAPPLYLSNSELTLNVASPFSVSGGKLHLNTAGGLTVEGPNLAAQVVAPLLVGGNGIKLAYSPFFTTISNQLSPSKYCCFTSGLSYPLNLGGNTKTNFSLTLERIGTMVHGILRLQQCTTPQAVKKYLILHMTQEGHLTVPDSEFQNENTVFYTQQLAPCGTLNMSPDSKMGIIPAPVEQSETYIPTRTSAPVALLINDTGSKYLARTLTFVINLPESNTTYHMEPFMFSYMPLY